MHRDMASAIVLLEQVWKLAQALLLSLYMYNREDLV